MKQVEKVVMPSDIEIATNKMKNILDENCSVKKEMFGQDILHLISKQDCRIKKLELDLLEAKIITIEKVKDLLK